MGTYGFDWKYEYFPCPNTTVWLNYGSFMKVLALVPEEQTGVIHEFKAFATEGNESTDDHSVQL